MQLGGSTEFNWNYEDRIRRDCGAVTIDEKESQRPGDYQLSGFDPSAQHADNYANRMDEVMQFQKALIEEKLSSRVRFAIIVDLSNLRKLNQLFTLPYAGFLVTRPTLTRQ